MKWLIQIPFEIAPSHMEQRQSVVRILFRQYRTTLVVQMRSQIFRQIV